MYSLPITTYSDYWRATKVWSSYLGGLAVFAAGTRYSVLGAPDITPTMQPTFNQTIQSMKINKLEAEVSFLEPMLRASSQGTVSRGISIQGQSSPAVANQGAPRQEAE